MEKVLKGEFDGIALHDTHCDSHASCAVILSKHLQTESTSCAIGTPLS